MIHGITLARISRHQGYGIAVVDSKRSKHVTYYIWSDVKDYKQGYPAEWTVREGPPDSDRKACNQSRYDLVARMGELIISLQEDLAQ